MGLIIGLIFPNNALSSLTNKLNLVKIKCQDINYAIDNFSHKNVENNISQIEKSKKIL